MLRVVSGLLLASILWLPNARADEKTSVAVMPLSPQRIPKEITNILDELLVTEVYDKSGMKVIGASDINAMLGFEEMKSAVGCDDVSCAAEIGGALGVDLMLSGTVGRLGGELIITLKLIDISKTELRNRISLRIPDKESEYAAGLGDAVGKLFGLDTGSETEPEPEPEPEPDAEPEPEPDAEPGPEPGPTTPAPADAEPEPEPEPERSDDHLANSVAVGFGAHILGFEVEDGSWGLSDPAPGDDVMGAVIEYRRKHSSYFTTKARVLLGSREFYADNSDVYVENTDEAFESPDVSSFGAVIGVFEEFTLPVWTGPQLPGANPTLELVVEAGVELMPPREAPHMDLFVALDAGGGIRFYWLTLEVLAVIPVAGAEQDTMFTINQTETCELTSPPPGCTAPASKTLTANAVNLMGLVSVSFSF